MQGGGGVTMNGDKRHGGGYGREESRACAAPRKIKDQVFNSEAKSWD